MISKSQIDSSLPNNFLRIIFYNYFNFSLGQFVPPPALPGSFSVSLIKTDYQESFLMTNVGTRELRGRPRPEDQSWLVITRPNYYFLILSPAAPPSRGGWSPAPATGG